MTALRLRVAAIVYGTLAFLALAWGVLRGDPNIFRHPGGWLQLGLSVSLLLGLAVGVAVGILVAWGTRLSVRRFGFAKKLHVEFRAVFGPLSERHILAFSLLSAVSEEMVFRGALQPAIGLVLASLAFGVMHVGPRIRLFWPWTASALAMGFLFGLLFQLFGDLTAPIVAHFAVNYMNLSFINDYDPMPGVASTMRRGDIG